MKGLSAEPVLRKATTQGAGDIGGRSYGIGEDAAVVARLGRAEYVEALSMFRPIEDAAIDEDAGDAVAMPAHVLRHRVQHDIAAMLDRAAEGGRRSGKSDRYRVSSRLALLAGVDGLGL